jgi:hypothetical protein
LQFGDLYQLAVQELLVAAALLSLSLEGASVHQDAGSSVLQHQLYLPVL